MLKASFTKPWLAVGLIVAAGYAFTGPLAMGHGKNHNPTRHQYVMKNGVPAVYDGKLTPFAATSENLVTGESLYVDNCVDCHGARGKSNTEAAKELKPPPAVLAGMYDRKMTGMDASGSGAHMMHGKMHHHPGMSHAEAMGGLNLDAYNFWAISEGGEMIGSDMPEFKSLLTEQQRWQIILYVAKGFNTEKDG